MTTTQRLVDLAVIQLSLQYGLMAVIEKEYLEAYHLRQALRQLRIRERAGAEV